MAQEEQTRCGYVALIGATNAGKSTLVNTIVGTKVAIVSNKAQTTRARMLGITICGASQILLVDTPGIFAPRRRFDRAMVRAAWQGRDRADVSLLLVDAESGIDKDVKRILDRLDESVSPDLPENPDHSEHPEATATEEKPAPGGRDIWLVLNKIDRMPRPWLLELSAALNESGRFARSFMISALNGDGVNDLVQALAKALPQGPWLYGQDQITDISEQRMAAEVTREKLFERLHEDLPYALCVETIDWRETPDGGLRIEQKVLVRRESQRAIVLGRGGKRIRSVGIAARHELTTLLGRPIHLFLVVKTHARWQEEPAHYTHWGLDFDA